MPNRTEGTRRKPRHLPTGRLPSLRLFSTLLRLILKIHGQGEKKAYPGGHSQNSVGRERHELIVNAGITGNFT
jgi:hypothetical protein